MTMTLQRADTSAAPGANGRHMISPFLLLVLLAAVLWMGALRARRRRLKPPEAGPRDGTQDR
jgi:hypothetical protein